MAGCPLPVLIWLSLASLKHGWFLSDFHFYTNPQKGQRCRFAEDVGMRRFGHTVKRWQEVGWHIRNYSQVTGERLLPANLLRVGSRVPLFDYPQDRLGTRGAPFRGNEPMLGLEPWLILVCCLQASFFSGSHVPLCFLARMIHGFGMGELLQTNGAFEW